MLRKEYRMIRTRANILMELFLEYITYRHDTQSVSQMFKHKE